MILLMFFQLLCQVLWCLAGFCCWKPDTKFCLMNLYNQRRIEIQLRYICMSFDAENAPQNFCRGKKIPQSNLELVDATWCASPCSRVPNVSLASIPFLMELPTIKWNSGQVYLGWCKSFAPTKFNMETKTWWFGKSIWFKFSDFGVIYGKFQGGAPLERPRSGLQV